MGLVRVHPHVFGAVLDDLTVAQWQVAHEAGALRILLVATGTPIRWPGAGTPSPPS